MNNHLIIFAKNPVLGKVKTRLAATVGDEKALSVYRELLQHTCDVSAQVDANKLVFYSDFINNKDLWDQPNYIKKLQKEGDLGTRMSDAFENTLKENTKVIIIGTDCKELTPDILSQAFNTLNYVDVVIGPAFDGGYYLIGMKTMEESLFQGIDWSTSSVLEQTVNKLNRQKLSYVLLKTLSDIDTEEDLKKSKS